MNKIAKCSLWIAAVSLLVACQPENPLAYENDPAVYFDGAYIEGYSRNARTQDSIVISFAEQGGDSCTVYVEVLTQGMMDKNANRPFILVQSETAPPNGYERAVPDHDFIALTASEVSDSCYIPAGKVYTRIPVTLKRSAEMLQGKRLVLDLELAPNDNFRLGMKTHLHYRIKFSGLPEKPVNWDSEWGPRCFGLTWGPVKHQFILDVCGPVTWNPFPKDYALITYYQTLVKDALTEYNQAHQGAPLCEDDGTPVTFE